MSLNNFVEISASLFKKNLFCRWKERALANWEKLKIKIADSAKAAEKKLALEKPKKWYINRMTSFVSKTSGRMIKVRTGNTDARPRASRRATAETNPMRE